jgi:putative tryptophan/tyrosine transport system substrate-binding protein
MVRSNGNRHRKAAIHIRAWRRGRCMAARCACAAAGPDATDRHADEPAGRFTWTGLVRGICPGIAAIGLGNWPQFTDRHPWGAGDTERFRKYAAELVALAPDVLVGTANSIVGDLQQASRTIPIVFVMTIDPVGSGLVKSLAHPGGNSTGFTAYEFSLNAKLLDLLKEITPDLKRVAVVRDATVPAGSGGFASIQTAASSSGVEVTAVGVHDAEEIERGITDFARGPMGGLIVVGPLSSVASHRDLIVGLAAQHHLPAVYSSLGFVGSGALISYGVDGIDQFPQAAGYVDRILKGEKPADLPVQAPTKYQLVNLKTVKALGLDVPPALLAIADKVIE